jgi:hypothetical protein
MKSQMALLHTIEELVYVRSIHTNSIPILVLRRPKLKDTNAKTTTRKKTNTAQNYIFQALTFSITAPQVQPK